MVHNNVLKKMLWNQLHIIRALISKYGTVPNVIHNFVDKTVKEKAKLSDITIP